MQTRKLLRNAASQVISRIPDIRGRARLACLVNRWLLSPSDSECTVEAKMRLGHRMIVDLRANGECPSFYTHDYDTEDICACLRLFEPDSVVLDVGANVGFWTVPMARVLSGGGKIHAFEPLPSNLKRLRENVRLNGLEGVVEIHEVGLSDKAATVEISLREDFSNGSDTGNAAIVIDESDRQFRCTAIAVEALDEVFPSLKLERLDFAKVDIEGHEDKFLAGASSVISQFRPVLYMEINEPYYTRRGLDATELFQAWLDSAGYVCALRGPDGWIQRELRLRKPVIDNVLFLPKERSKEILSKFQ